MEPDRRFDGLWIIKKVPVLACQRQHRFDVSQAMIVAIFGVIERGKLAF